MMGIFTALCGLQQDWQGALIHGEGCEPLH